MAEAFPANSDSDFSDEDLSPLDTSFNKAADHVKKITANLDNNQLLELYGLYKQSIDGKCNTTRPGWLDGRGRRKWDAWKSLGDLPSDEAKIQYIALVQKYDPELTVGSAKLDGKKESWAAVSSMQYSPEPELIHNELSLLDAARENCAERVTQLLEKNPELKHERDEDGLTALHWAADRDALDALAAAIKGGCPIDATDECGQTALHYAAACGHLQSTRALVNAGAAMVKDNEDCIPLDLTSDDEIKEILEGAAIF